MSAGDRGGRGRSGPRWSIGRVVALVAAAVAAFVVFGWLGGLLHNPFREDTVDRSGPALLRSIEDIGEYRAATGNFEQIVDLEKDTPFVPDFIKGERTTFLAAGTVDAGVDFSALGPDAIQTSRDRRSATITLPPVRFYDAEVDTGRSYVADRDRGLLDRIGGLFTDNPTGERELRLLAERKLAAAAADERSGLRAQAEKNVTAMLRSLLGSLGYTDVTVNFMEPPKK